MKITYPNMGNLGIGVKSILQEIAFEVIPPPPISKRSANLGIRLAPEGACYPFKLVLGNVIEGLELGADTVIMLGGGGPCRFGYFGHLMGEILKDSGFHCNTIILDGQEVIDQVNALRTSARVGWSDVGRALRMGWQKMALADSIEASASRLRPTEKVSGQISEWLKRGLGSIDDAASIKVLKALEKELQEELDSSLKQAERPALRVGLVGDIYMLIEPYANHRLEEVLGHLGVEVYRSIYVSNWVKEHLGKWFSHMHQKGLLADAEPYLRDFVGGHGLDTVANIVRYHRQGFDGIIHILPMTCMPEIVAQSITPSLNRDLGIPVMTLVLDEHSGTAGIQSRVEAFVDVLSRRKAQAAR